MFLEEKAEFGKDIDEKAAERYHYEQACLPVNRKTDGTLFYCKNQVSGGRKSVKPA
ncbi:MAG: hypothetical protein ACQEQ0_15070 [Bacteroidota bacterium]